MHELAGTVTCSCTSWLEQLHVVARVGWKSLTEILINIVLAWPRFEFLPPSFLCTEKWDTASDEKLEGETGNEDTCSSRLLASLSTFMRNVITLVKYDYLTILVADGFPL